MYIYPNFVNKQATRYVFSLDYVMFLTSQVGCYYIIVLLNAILTIVQLSGTSVVSITHIKLKISKKRPSKGLCLINCAAYEICMKYI